ncbi:MAG: acetoin utilization protein AcuC [Kiritimatiellae bacterium]|nr:acetoin utilization protein AcuC [Kiritimatiellia bacterium]
MATGDIAVFLYSHELEDERYPDDCPLKTERVLRTREIVSSLGLLSDSRVEEVNFAPAGRSDLEAFHLPAYLDALEAAAAGHHRLEYLEMGIGSKDCPVFPDMYSYGQLACGGTLTAADLITSGDAHIVFNPSGGFHHAGPAMASGFCYLNDIVLGCLRFTEVGMKVLVLDLDAHHGEGVQEAFYDRNDVIYISLHESGRTLFPGTGFEREIGADSGRGYTVNMPLPVDTYDDAYLECFQQVVMPLIAAYAPDVIVMELGMDALSGDPLAHLALTNNAYATIVDNVVEFGTPLLATGGGGYHPDNTARSWAFLWGVMSGGVAIDHPPLALGGVFLESTEWHGGLQDRTQVPTVKQRRSVEPAVANTIERIRRDIFPCHSISS